MSRNMTAWLSADVLLSFYMTGQTVWKFSSMLIRITALTAPFRQRISRLRRRRISCASLTREGAISTIRIQAGNGAICPSSTCASTPAASGWMRAWTSLQVWCRSNKIGFYSLQCIKRYDILLNGNTITVGGSPSAEGMWPSKGTGFCTMYRAV